MRPDAPRYLPTLDGWRGLAILGVLLAHGCEAILGPGGTSPDAFGYVVTRYGTLGVDLFFALSGLLISWVLLDEHARTGAISLTGFYLRRVFRILPAYAASLLVLALLASGTTLVVGAREWTGSMLFLRNYTSVPDGDGWYTAHFWSLAVEEHFYLIWPALLAAAGIRRARLAAIALALVVASWRVVEFRWQLVPGLVGGVPFTGRTDIRLDALLWGCAAALWLRELGPDRVRGWLPKGAEYATAVLLLVNAVVSPPLALLWQSMLFPALLVSTLLHADGRLGRLLDTAALRWVGRVSYSLYLWQQLFLVGGVEARVLPLGVWQTWPLNVLAVFGCAAASYYCIERPTLALSRVFAARPPGVPVLAAISR